MSESTKLAVLNEVERRLAEVETIDEAKELRDQAEAVRVYAKSAKKGLEIQNRAAAIKIMAECRAGELLAAMNLKAGRPKNGNTASLAALQIDEHQSRRWQTIAPLRSQILALETEMTSENRELTSAEMYTRARKEMAVEQVAPSDEILLAAFERCLAAGIDRLMEMKRQRPDLLRGARALAGQVRREKAA